MKLHDKKISQIYTCNRHFYELIFTNEYKWFKMKETTLLNVRIIRHLPIGLHLRGKDFVIWVNANKRDFWQETVRMMDHHLRPRSWARTGSGPPDLTRDHCRVVAIVFRTRYPCLCPKKSYLVTPCLKNSDKFVFSYTNVCQFFNSIERKNSEREMEKQ